MRHHRLVSRLLFALVSAFFGGLHLPIASAGDWPQWRGPSGQGVCSEKDLPLEWSATKNVRWRIPLPARGNSTPVVSGSRVFLTQSSPKGERRSTWCVERTRGEILWKKTVEFSGEEPTHSTNPFCSASPVTDGTRVIAFHGSAGVHCYDLDGNLLWSRDLGPFRHIWGNASSPVIWKNVCLLNCGPGPRTSLTALDKKSGKTLWSVPIPGGEEGTDGVSKSWKGSWSTPLVITEKVDGGGARDVVLIGYPGKLSAFDPATGREIWSCGGLGPLVYTSVIAREGVAVSMSGYMGPPLAVRLGGAGDVTTTRRLWRQPRAQQHIGSGVIHRGHIYVHNDPGTVECIELNSGKLVWRERPGAKSWSSVVLSGDRLYALDDRGTCHVLRAAPRYEVLAKNALGEPTRASVAVSNGDLFIRTYKHLWCISDGGSR